MCEGEGSAAERRAHRSESPPTALRAGGRAGSVLSRLRVLTANTARVPEVPREYRVSTAGGAAVKNHLGSKSYSVCIIAHCAYSAYGLTRIRVTDSCSLWGFIAFKVTDKATACVTL